MAAYLKSAPVGVAGDITRTDFSEVEPAMLQAVGGVYPAGYGVPVKYVTGGVGTLVASDAGSVVAGMLVREVPQYSGIASDTSYDSLAPQTNRPQGMMTAGYMSVKCTVGTPVRGGAVYVCNNTAGGNIGDLQATSSANNSVIPNASWASDGKDAYNNAEMRLSKLK